MAREESSSSSFSLMLSLLLWLSAHGEPSLATVSGTDVQQSKSSLSTVERAVLSGDELIGIGLGLGARLPVRASKIDPSHKRHSYLDFPEEYDLPISEELTGEEIPEHSDDVIKVEFRNSDHPSTPDFLPDSKWMTTVPRPLQQRVGDPTAWTLSDFYNYLSPEDELSALDTTLDPEPTLTPPTDMEDENPSLTYSPFPSVTLGNNNPRPPSQSQPPPLSSLSQGSGGCGLGFVRPEAGSECVSECDAQPDFCNNRGVCIIVTGIGPFCRCNLQDYVWNKGSRCDWVVTDFQVLCVIVGVASLTLVLLIVIIVFFAKRLHRLRMENRRLRKRSFNRPHSEMQTDGSSVSTAPGVSNANDDPQKIEDLVKTPPTEESLNIANSHSPKHVNNCSAHSSDHTPNDDMEDGVTIGLQLLLPKEAKLRPAASPPLQYDIFLYKKGAGPSSATNNNSNYTSHNMVEGRNPSNPNTLPNRTCSMMSRSYTSKSNPDLNHSPNLNHGHIKEAPASQNHFSPHRHHSSPSPDHSSPCVSSPQQASVAPYQASPHNPSPPHHPLYPPSSPLLRILRGRCGAPLVPLHPSPSSPLLRYTYSTDPCSPQLPRAKYNPISTYSLS